MTDDFGDSLRFVAELLERLRLRYMVVGSVAALAHGRARTTQDVDIVVELALDAVDDLVAGFPEDRFYVSIDAARDAVRRQTLFNVIDLVTGWKIDLVPRKRRAFSEVELKRRQRLDVVGIPLWVATLEDTIVSKLEWARLGGSARQLEDAAELFRLGGEALDRAHIERWVQELGLEQSWGELLRAVAD